MRRVVAVGSLIGLASSAGCVCVIGTEVRRLDDHDAGQTCAADSCPAPAECKRAICAGGACAEAAAADGDACGANGVCVAGTCNDECQPGETKCDDSTPRSCGDAHLWSVDDAPCPGDRVCDDGACRVGIAALATGCGGTHTCLVATDGTVRCWGKNTRGQLGTGDFAKRTTPSPVVGLPPAVAVAAGHEHTCALLGTGDVWCWGRNDFGQAGDPGLKSVSTPHAIVGLSGVVQVAAASHTTCALTDADEVHCWGINDGGQVNGVVDQDPHPAPALVDGVSDVREVVRGTIRSCAVHHDGTVTCWGVDDGPPTPKWPELGAVEQLAMCDLHECARNAAGDIWCWGEVNQYGEIGDGTVDVSYVPVALDAPTNVDLVQVGWRHTCAVTDGQPWCWGYNHEGTLGVGNFGEGSYDPLQVALDAPANALYSGWSHNCVRVGTRKLYCWGNNLSGQVGNGTTDNQSLPVEIAWE